MKFEKQTSRVLQAGKLLGIRLRFSSDWRKYFEISWLIFILWNLVITSAFGFHFIFYNLNNFERALFWYGQLSNSFNAVIRINLILYQRKAMRSLIDELIELTKKSKV